MIPIDIKAESSLQVQRVKSFSRLVQVQNDPEYKLRYDRTESETPIVDEALVITGGPSRHEVDRLMAYAWRQSSSHLYYMKLDNVYLLPRFGTIFLAEEAAVLDTSLYALCGHTMIMSWLQGRIAGVEVSQDGGLLLDPKLLNGAEEIATPMLYPLHAGYCVYGHWWYDCMPAMYGAREALATGAARLLFPPGSLTSWQKDAVELLGVDTAVQHAQTEVVFCKSLIVPSFISLANTRSCSAISAEMFAYLRQAFVTRHGEPKGRSKLYISRRSFSSYRKMVNEDEVEAALKARGFRILQPETMSLSEQIAAFMSADVVVGAAGSGTVNIGFARPGAALVDLVVDGNIDIAFFMRARALCLSVGGVYAVHGEADASLDPELMATPESLDPSMLYSYRLTIHDLMNVIDQVDSLRRH